MRAWHTLRWQGQSGADGGRDIVGVCDDRHGHPKTVVVACANWQSITAAKATSDIDALVQTMGGPPGEVIVATASSVSAGTRDKIEEHARSKGIRESQIWSGVEFAENLRFHAPSVLKRFYEGVELPDDDVALRKFVAELDPLDPN